MLSLTSDMAAHSLLFSRDGDTSAKLREWSSTIGIVTAIIGNVLISFALNVQRYAHIRLEREKRGGKQGWLGRKKRTHTSYGTEEQEQIAEDRVRANLDPAYEDGRVSPSSNGSANGEPGRKHSYTHSRSSSESTIKPSEKQQEAASGKTYLSSPYWWLGLTLMIVGETGNFLAYGFAPASIVSPLGVVALVSNCIIAPCLLGERFRQRDVWGVIIAIGGAVTVVLSAKQSETKMGPSEIWTAITRWEFETYLGITVGLIVILMIFSSRYGDRSILIDLGLVGLFGGCYIDETQLFSHANIL